MRVAYLCFPSAEAHASAHLTSTTRNIPMGPEPNFGIGKTQPFASLRRRCFNLVVDNNVAAGALFFSLSLSRSLATASELCCFTGHWFYGSRRRRQLCFCASRWLRLLPALCRRRGGCNYAIQAIGKLNNGARKRSRSHASRRRRRRCCRKSNRLKP